jgi:hypothetical protein
VNRCQQSASRLHDKLTYKELDGGGMEQKAMGASEKMGVGGGVCI